jgi:hypothetical protein
MDNKPRPFCRGDDISRVHRIAFDPIERQMGQSANRFLRLSMQRANIPATSQECASGLKAHAARRANNEHNIVFCHVMLA